MPSNTQTIKIEVNAQENTAALDKVVKAIAAAGGQATGGGISKTFSGMEEAVSFLKEQAAAQKKIGGQLTGASVKQTAGGFEATAGVAEAQKKAFNPGGMIAGMATGVGVAVGIFKTFLGMSKIFQTFMGTTGKILATAVDLMLAPLMPFIMRIMVWLIQTIFPLATKAGNWLGGLGDVGIGAALTGGYVALKFGPTLLSKAGESLGKALLEKMPFDTFGENITYGLLEAKDKLKDWGVAAAGHISSGFNTAISTISDWYDSVATGISSAFNSVTSTIGEWYTSVASGISSAFNSVTSTLGDWYSTVAEGISGAFNAATSAIGDYYKTVAEGISGAFNAATSAIGDYYKTIAEGISGAFNAATGVIGDYYKTIAEGISGAFNAATGVIGEYYKTIAEGISGAFNAATSVIGNFYTTIAEGISGAFDAATSMIGDYYKTIAEGISGAFDAATSMIGNFYKTVAEGISGAFDAAASTVGDWYKTIAEGISGAFNAAASQVGKWYDTIAEGISGAFNAAASTLETWYSTIAEGIGGALATVSGWASKAGEKIADAIKGAPAWMKIGGIVALGIGALALGAAIGYSMWKTYKEHEAGKDVIGQQTNLQLLDMFTQQYGLDKDTSKALITDIRADDAFLGRDKENMQIFAQNYTDLLRAIQEFGVDDLSNITPLLKTFKGPEMDFVLEQLQRQEMERRDVGLGSYLPQSRRIEAEMRRLETERLTQEYQVVADVRAGGGNIAVGSAQRQATGPGTGYLTKSGAYTGWQGMAELEGQYERSLRKILEEVYPGQDYTEKGFWGTITRQGGYKRELTEAEALIGWAVTLAQDADRATLFLSDPTRTETLGREYAGQTLAQWAPEIKIVIDADVLGFLSPTEMENFKQILQLPTGSVLPK